MLKEFKEFALKGSIIDLAVGVIIGGAFQKIVTSLVDDIIMPLISAMTGNVNFDHLTAQVGSATINYGLFITAVVDFILVALCLFLIIRYINKLNKKIEAMKEAEIEKLVAQGKLKRRKTDTPDEGPTTKICPHCFSEINIQATRCPHCTSELEENE